MDDHQLYAVGPDGAEPLTWPPGASSVHEAFDDLPLGVYSALRTFEHNKFLWLEHHLARTEQSMRLLGWDYELDQMALCRALHEACTTYPGEDARVRFDVLAAAATKLGTNSRILIALSPFAPVPGEYIESGVEVELAPELRRENPIIKTAEFVVRRRPYPLGHRLAYEHLILDERGAILECSSANFFVVRGDQLRTAGAGVLEGITRKIILRLAADEGVPVLLEPALLQDMPALTEAFLSSSSRGLVPVVGIAGQRIGSGLPGPITRRLQAAYEAFVARETRSALASIP